jgi:hypothetical protein
MPATFPELRQITLKDIQNRGLSFNWRLKKHTGYFNTDGGGNVVWFVRLCCSRPDRRWVAV